MSGEEVLGVEVRVAVGTRRSLPFDIEAMACRVFDENTGEVLKERHREDDVYSTIVVLGPGRTDFSVTGSLEAHAGMTVKRICQEWVGA